MKAKKPLYINTSIVAEVWQAGIMLWVCTPEKGTELLKKYGLHPEITIENWNNGKCIQKDSKNPIIWINSNLPQNELVGTLSHELLHATFFILEIKGVPINYENSEPFTYLLQHFTEKCLDKINK